MGSRASRSLLRTLQVLFCFSLCNFVFCLSSIGLARAETGGRWLDVQFPHDSPVLPIDISLQEPSPTTARVRGASIIIDLHASLLLRNTGVKPISGLTLVVDAPDLTPAGRGSVTVPSLHAQPGAVFPVSINMQLLRPLSMGQNKGPLMQVSLDCALFSDFSAYGPDNLHSRRSLMVYELEARRDRHYLAKLLEDGRLAELREELNFGLESFGPPQLSLELLRRPDGRLNGEQPVPVGAVAFPSSPIRPLGGNAEVLGNEVTTSRLELRNISGKTIKNFDVGWVIRDERGRDFLAGSVPSAMQLGPVQTANMTAPDTLRLTNPSGQPMVVDALLAFVNNVEFSDGKLWIPSRLDISEATNDPVLRRALTSSPEQQRLAAIYRRKGMSGLQEELKKFP